MPFSGPWGVVRPCIEFPVARRDEQSPSRLRSQPPQLPSLASGAVEKRSPSQAFAPFRGRSTSRVNVDHACLSLACGSTPLPTLTGFLQFSRLESWASGHHRHRPRSRPPTSRWSPPLTWTAKTTWTPGRPRRAPQSTCPTASSPPGSKQLCPLQRLHSHSSSQAPVSMMLIRSPLTR